MKTHPSNRTPRGGIVVGFWLLTAAFTPNLLQAAFVHYSYDALNRLAQVSFADSSTFTYSYDSLGNWTTNTVTVMTDTDGDGIPDWWMNQYFGHPTGQAGDNSRANDDADGDGMTNLQEFLAGTSPIDAASALRIAWATVQGTNVILSLSTVTNRLYVIEWKTDITNGDWTALPDFVTGDGTVQQVAHIGAATLPQRFYRLRLLY